MKKYSYCGKNGNKISGGAAMKRDKKTQRKVMHAAILLVISKFFYKLSFKIINSIQPVKPAENDIYKKKCEFLYDNRFDYYYTLMCNIPEDFADTLAKADVNYYKQTNQINKLYTNLRLRGNAIYN